MNVLVDSSVWVGHFQHRNEHLVALLEADAVVCHPNIVVEVACGTPTGRQGDHQYVGRAGKCAGGNSE